MDWMMEPARRTPVAAEVDVCVVGGSCTGVFAAVRAAQAGMRVAVIEASGFFGGVATAGLVNIWHSLYDTENRQQIIGGLTLEVIERLKARDAVTAKDPTADTAFVLNTEELKIELDALVAEHGVRPFLHARFVQPLLEDGRLAAVAIEDKSGRRAVRARCFVDATGDGDLIVRLGLPARRLDDLQPPTTCVILRGLNEVWRHAPGLNLSKAVFDPAHPKALKRGFLWWSLVPGTADERMIAGTRVNGADCSDADELTRAEMEGRRQARAIRDIFHEDFRGGEAVSIVSLPAHIGIRETRHAECLHRLTESEVLEGVRFDDAVANGSYRVDVHHSERGGITFRYQDGREVYIDQDGRHEERRWRPQRDQNPTFYQIPYRSLVPRGASNVLAAGRLIDADRGAYGAIRVMVNCNQTGEAAGEAAALALETGRSVAEIDAAELRKRLAARGAVIL